MLEVMYLENGLAIVLRYIGELLLIRKILFPLHHMLVICKFALEDTLRS